MGCVGWGGVIPVRLRLCGALNRGTNNAARTRNPSTTCSRVSPVCGNRTRVASAAEALSPSGRPTPRPYDVVFMDWLMPGMTAFSRPRPHADASLQHPPAIVMVHRIWTGRGCVARGGPKTPPKLDGFLGQPLTTSPFWLYTLGGGFADPADQPPAVASAAADGVSLNGRLPHLCSPGHRYQPAYRRRAPRSVGAMVDVFNNESKVPVAKLFGGPIPLPTTRSHGFADAGDGRDISDTEDRVPIRFSRSCPIYAITCACHDGRTRPSAFAHGMTGHSPSPRSGASLRHSRKFGGNRDPDAGVGAASGRHGRENGPRGPLSVDSTVSFRFAPTPWRRSAANESATRHCFRRVSQAPCKPETV